MNKLLIGGAAAALVVGLAPAIAQPAPPQPGVAQGTGPAPLVTPPGPGAPGVRVKVMSDRVMTRDEVVKHVRAMFARFDTNHDGFVTKDEMDVFHQKMAGAVAMRGDMEKRFAEHRPDRAAMFDKLDTNHDGVISKQEFMAARPEMHERRMFVMGEGGAPGAPGQAGMHRMMGMHMHGAAMHMGGGHLFEMADTNHDGRVSLQEAEAAALAHFDRADLNHDGKITPDERRQAHQLMRGEHRPS